MAPRLKVGTGPTKFERPQKFQTLLYTDILQSQQTDAAGDLADTELICDGGCIRVHGFLLQGASRIFRKAMASQGVDYPHVRKILLPDFHVKSIERMLSLIYKGYVDLPTDPDVESLKEVLKFFQVSEVDFEHNEHQDCRILTGTLKVQELNRIPQDIFKIDRERSPIKPELMDAKPKVAAVIKTVKKNSTKKKEEEPVPGPSPQTPLRRSGRAKKPVVRLKKAENDADKSDDSDFKGSSGTDSSSDEEPSDSESQPKPKGGRPGRRPDTQVVNPSGKLGGTSGTTLKRDEQKTGNSNAKVADKEDQKDKDDRKDKDDEDSGTDSEDEDWVKPNFKDKEWFLRESKRCQCCKKSYDLPADAALCITSHKSIRCYFCFKVYSTTDILFKHFRKRHKQAGRANTLICPYCDQNVPYKSVSCHVISVHLSKKELGLEEDNPSSSESVASTSSKSVSKVSKSQPSGGSRRSRSRSSSVERMSSSERQPQKKKLKIPNSKGTKPTVIEKKKGGEKGTNLQARNLDVTLEKRTCVGTTIRFRIQKLPPVLANGDS